MSADSDEVVRVVEPELSGAANARVMALVRIGVGLMWLTNVGWKTPPDFGRASESGLYRYTVAAVDFPVPGPYSWVVEHLVLPNFTAFGWVVLITEALLAAFLLLGLGTRFWALVGVAQSAAIGMSVALLPHEWPWAYYLMVMVHGSLWATAAGRTWGLDALARPALRLSKSRWARLSSAAT